jgi:hypothetical protein
VGPPGLIVGNTCTAWLTVTNTGSMAATGVEASLSSGDPAVILVAGGPSPAGALTLLPGASVTFGWSLRAVTGGEAVLQASVTGMDSKTLTVLTLQNLAAVKAVKVGARADSLLVAPNVLDLSLGDGAIVCYVKGKTGQDVTIRFYNAAGRFMGSRTVGLDTRGEGRLEYTARGLDGVRPVAGVAWAVASGGGVSDRKKFLVVPGQ